MNKDMKTFSTLEKIQDGYKLGINLEAIIKQKDDYVFIKFLDVWFCCDSDYGDWAIAEEYDSHEYRGNEDDVNALAMLLGYNIHDFHRFIKSHLNVIFLIYTSKMQKKAYNE